MLFCHHLRIPPTAQGLNDFFNNCESDRSVCGSSNAFVINQAKKTLNGAGLRGSDVHKYVGELRRGGKFDSELGSFLARREEALKDLVGDLDVDGENLEEVRSDGERSGKRNGGLPPLVASRTFLPPLELEPKPQLSASMEQNSV